MFYTNAWYVWIVQKMSITTIYKFQLASFWPGIDLHSLDTLALASDHAEHLNISAYI